MTQAMYVFDNLCIGTVVRQLLEVAIANGVRRNGVPFVEV